MRRILRLPDGDFGAAELLELLGDPPSGTASTSTKAA
jgi:hypothetical protein